MLYFGEVERGLSRTLSLLLTTAAVLTLTWDCLKLAMLTFSVLSRCSFFDFER